MCLSKVDNKQHNIAEVSLKDMYCAADVKDKKGRKSLKVCVGVRVILTNKVFISI